MEPSLGQDNNSNILLLYIYYLIEYFKYVQFMLYYLYLDKALFLKQES